MKLRIIENYCAVNNFTSAQNPDRIASEWFGRKVGAVDINDYMRYEKGQDAEIVDMKATEYLHRCVDDIFHSTWEKTITPIVKGNQELIDRYANDMLNGDKFPLPYLDYTTLNQEGRHRALAAINAYGDDVIIPVIIIKPTQPTKQELKDYCNRKFPNNKTQANMFYDGLLWKYFKDEIEYEEEQDYEISSDEHIEDTNEPDIIDDELMNLYISDDELMNMDFDDMMKYIKNSRYR